MSQLADEAERIVARLPWWRHALYILISIGLGLALFAILAEVACRILPVNEGLRSQPVNAEAPVFRFEADRVSTWSKDWNFSIVNRVRVNNEGFVNDQDYHVDGPRPLLAVVGDSYVEAAMVPFAETVQGRLAAALGERGRVYSFAASGAGFPQHLAWAEYARDKFAPDVFVFLVIGNDFSESLYHRERSPGFHHFERLPDDGVRMRRVDYDPSFLRRALRHSALAMYLITNVKIQHGLNFDVQNLGADDRRWVGNIEREGSERDFDDFRWATRTYLDLIPGATGLPPERVVIAMDGLRDAVYQPALKGELLDSVWGKMRAYVAEQAEARGFVVIDMHPVFERAHARDGRRFEFPTDSHWNGHGHGLLADAVVETALFADLFPASLPK